MPEVLAEMRVLIEEAYRVFPEQRVTGRLWVCNCDCCVPDADEVVLRQTPRRKLSAARLEKYVGAVDTCDDWRKHVEFRHFLPRLFELHALLGQRDGFRLSSPNLFDRLGAKKFRYRHWRADEVELIDRLFDASLRMHLARPLVARDRGDGLLVFGGFGAVERLLKTACGAGADLGRLLRIWSDDRSFAATVHIAATINFGARDWSADGRRRKTVKLLSSTKDVRRKEKRIVAWLMNRAQVARLDQAVRAAPDMPTAQAIAEARDYVGTARDQRMKGAPCQRDIPSSRECDR